MASTLTLTGAVSTVEGTETLGPLTLAGAASQLGQSVFGTGIVGDQAITVPTTAKAMLVLPGGFAAGQPTVLTMRLTGQGAGTAIPISIYGPTMIAFDTPPAGITFNLSVAIASPAILAVKFV